MDGKRTDGEAVVGRIETLLTDQKRNLTRQVGDAGSDQGPMIGASFDIGGR